MEQRWSDVDRRVAREAIEPARRWCDDFLLVSLGALQAHKRPDVLLQALARARRERDDLRLLLVGEERPAEFDLSASLANLGLEDAVHVTGWLPEIQAWRALHAADLCVNLRGPSAGGASGGASQALSLGRGVVVSELPENAHLPADCVLRVAPDETEIEQLARLFVELRDDGERRVKMEAAARCAVEEKLHWAHVARRYVEAMKTFPHARASRRSVIVRFAQATARAR